MTYPMLAACVVLAGFAAFSSILSVAALARWRVLGAHRWGDPGVVFRLRLLPALGAFVVAALWLLPAFHLFEPRNADEGPEWLLLASAAATVVLFGAGISRGWSAWWSTRALQRTWLIGAQPLPRIGSTLPAFRIESDHPIVAVVGFWRPRLFISARVLDACTPDELGAIVAHEAAHVAQFDNLRRLVLRCWPDPLAFTRAGRDIERCWCDASEAAADDRAAANDQGLRLQLAAALLRVASLASDPTPSPALASTFHDGADVARRVRRLLDNQPSTPRRSRWVFAVWSMLVTSSVATALLRPELLRPVHTLIELAVKTLP